MAKGLYVHVPFCIRKCKYCDFVSFQKKNCDKYLDSLINELEEYKGEEIDSIFIGGGTPTCLDNDELSRLLSFINSNFNIKPQSEWTVEMNPKTADEKKLLMMRDCGVNRISVGVQSFCDKELEIIGRVHNSREAKESLALVSGIFENFNIDLMSALPSQSIKSFISSVDTAISFNPTHISCYSLILEENTPLYQMNENGLLMLPDEDEEREMYETVCKKLGEAGYVQYEISNFAKTDRECVHNLKYWQCKEYIGTGLAAHSYIGNERFYNTSDMEEYIKGNRQAERIKLSDDDMCSEFIIMSLRLIKGIDLSEYKKRFKRDFTDDYKKEIEKFLKLGMLEYSDGFIRLTREGISLSNSVMCEFV